MNMSLKKDRRRKVFERIVNKVILKYMVDPFKHQGSCIAYDIPIKYLKYFKEVSASKNAKKIRYRYRGKSGMKKNMTTGNTSYYQRPQSFCHMDGADTFAIYYRNTNNNYFRYS